MQMPQIWQALCAFLDVPDRLSRAVWGWPQPCPVERRRRAPAGLLHEPMRTEVDGLAAAVLPFGTKGLTSQGYGRDACENRS